MELEEKFSEIKQDVGYGDFITLGNCGNDFAKQCVTIADEHAIKFAEWLIWQDITSRGKGVFVNDKGEIKTTTELLEIFKNQQDGK